MEKECLFCQIIAGERASDTVYRDDTLAVFKDINPHAPVHLLIVPRKHIRSVNDLTEDDRGIVAAMLMSARDVARKVGVDRSGYRLVFNVERGQGR